MTRFLRAIIGVLALFPLGCVGTTGGDTFSFEAFARGEGSASTGEPYLNGHGYAVAFSEARVHVGALYLNRSVQTSVSSGTSCVLQDVYVAEVPHALDVDALSDEPQRFPDLGRATSELARTGEVWLTGGDVNAPSDSTVILRAAGIATRRGDEFPFEAALTIGANRLQPTPPELPGLKPICKERIVTPVPVTLSLPRDGRLTLGIDVARMFANVDFSLLEAGSDGVFHFVDDSANADAASRNLYVGLHSSSGVYDFSTEH